MSKLLKIPLSRFQPGIPVTGNVYIYLPLNRRQLRILHAGDSLDSSDISRYRQKGHTEVLVEPSTPGEHQAETYALHPEQTSTGIEKTTHPVALVNAQESGSVSPVAPDFPATQAPAKEQTEVAAEAPETDEPVAASTDAGAKKKAKPEEEHDSSLKAQKNESESESVLKADKPETGPENKFKATNSEEEPESAFSPDQENETEPELRFKGDKREKQQTRIIKSKADAEEDEPEQRFSGAGKTEKVSSFVVKGGKQEKEKETRIIKNGPQEADEDQAMAAGQLRKQQSDQRLKNALASLDEGLPDEMLFEDNPPDELPPIEHNPLLDLEIPEIQESEEDKAAKILLQPDRQAPRDVRMTVSSLATQLAHSLGYSNQAFLTDLAITAMVHFAKLEGITPKANDKLPALTRLFLEGGEENSVAVADSKQIMFFLEKYLGEPECDRFSKDLAPAVFLKVEKNLGESNVNTWHLARWQQFAVKGPTLDTMTICSQASTSALKQIRSII